MSYSGNPVLYTLLMSTLTSLLTTATFSPALVIRSFMPKLESNSMIKGRSDRDLILMATGTLGLVLGLWIWSVVNLNYYVGQYGSITNVAPTAGSGVFNDKTSYIVPATGLLLAIALIDVVTQWMKYGWKAIRDNDNIEILISDNKRGTGMYVIKLSLFAAYTLYSTIYFFLMRTGYNAAVSTRSAVYSYMLISGILLCVSAGILGMYFNKKEKMFYEWLNENGIDIADEETITNKLNSTLKKGKGNSIQLRDKTVVYLTNDIAAILEASTNALVKANPANYIVVAMTDLDNNTVYRAIDKSKFTQREFYTFKSVLPMISPVDYLKTGLVAKTFNRTYGYFIKTSNIGDDGVHTPVDGFFPWVQLPVSVIAGFTIMRLAWSMVFFQTQQDGIISWFVESFPPLMIGGSYGFGHWLTSYAVNYLFFFAMGILQPTSLLESINNHVWTPTDFYRDSWNATAPDTDQQIAVLGNAEVLGAVGTGVSGFSIAWPLTIVVAYSVAFCLYGSVAKPVEAVGRNLEKYRKSNRV